MTEPWSESHIKHGTSYTSRQEFDKLENNLIKGKKRTFHAVDKTGSTLEVYGENPRIIVNELDTHSAAIWYGLYDGTLLNALQETERNQIQNILKKYFNSSTLPVIPILRTDVSKEPKYKLRGENTRVYSMYGGANIRTFLDIEIDPFETHRFPGAFEQLIERLKNNGFQIETPTIENIPVLSVCEEYLKIMEEVKIRLSENNKNLPQNKEIVIWLEFFTKMYVVLQILEVLGINHGHPHGGNWVTSWSKEQLDQSELETELINPTKISSEYSEMEKVYPNCSIHPLLIDFDRALFMSRKKGNYDTEKLLTLLNDPNRMHQVTALYLLPFEQWPSEFLLSIFDKNIIFTDQVVLKLKLWFKTESTASSLFAYFRPIIDSGVNMGDPTLEKFIVAMIPGQVASKDNIAGWKNWIRFFQAYPNLVSLKKKFLELAVREAEGIKDKDELIKVITALVEEEIGRGWSLPQFLLRRIRRENTPAEVFN